MMHVVLVAYDVVMWACQRWEGNIEWGKRKVEVCEEGERKGIKNMRKRGEKKEVTQMYRCRV